MKNHGKFCAILCLLIINVSYQQHPLRTEPFSSNVLKKHKAVHKVLEELSHAQAAEAVIEEKARVQRIVARELKKAYERDTGEEMVQMVNAKMSSLRAEQALKKVMQAQELMKIMDQEVFEAKVKNNELARSLIQVENDLINAQIEYISNNNESGIFDEKAKSYGQDLLDIMSVKYFTDMPAENKTSDQNSIKKLHDLVKPENTTFKKFNHLQFEPLTFKQLSPMNDSHSLPQTQSISDSLSISLPNSVIELNPIPKTNRQSILNSSIFVNPNMNLNGMVNEFPIPFPQVLQISQDHKNAFPEVKLAPVNLSPSQRIFNSSTQFKPGKNDIRLFNESLFLYPQVAQLVRDQEKLIPDVRSESDNIPLNFESRINSKFDNLNDASYYQSNRLANNTSQDVTPPKLNEKANHHMYSPHNNLKNSFSSLMITTKIAKNLQPQNYSVSKSIIESQNQISDSLSPSMKKAMNINPNRKNYLPNSKFRNNSQKSNVYYNFVKKINETKKHNSTLKKANQIYSNFIPKVLTNSDRRDKENKFSANLHDDKNFTDKKCDIFNRSSLNGPLNMLNQYSMTNPSLMYNNPNCNYIPPKQKLRNNKLKKKMSKSTEKLKIFNPLCDSSNMSDFSLMTKVPNLEVNTRYPKPKSPFPTISLNYGPIFESGKRYSFLNNENNEFNNEIDVRDVLNDLKSRKYIKRWNI